MSLRKFDVLVCGAGSAGLTAAVWLAQFGVNFRILERHSGPLRIGQADGVQCRTVEIFESLGISEPILRESYHVMELAFWSDDGQGQSRIHRTHLAPDTEPGLSHQPHVILNQARINEVILDEVKRLKGDSDPWIEYGCQVQQVKVTNEGCPGHDEDYPVEVTVLKGNASHLYKAKYVIGSDGAHSTVRKSLGFQMVGDSSDAVWGVMDVIAHTDFPDIRKKCPINSDSGNLLLIPREHDEMVRFYIELPGKKADEVTREYLHERARRIFHPYEIDIPYTAWWSAYSIGQRLANHFTKDFRVFLTGDACHTHSPKAGQGMNVSLQDGYNIGWKLGHLLSGRAPPEILVTYVSERQGTAKDLIDFDRHFTRLFSTTYRRENGITANDFKDEFIKAGRYTAGLGIRYGPSMLTWQSDDDSQIAAKLVVGMRFPSSVVLRVCDSRPLHLSRALPSDGRWHLVIFAGDMAESDNKSKLDQFSADLVNIIGLYTPETAQPDSMINTILVLSPQHAPELETLPELFSPHTGKLRMKRRTNVFIDNESYYNSDCGLAFQSYGIDKCRGAAIIVRPDLYVSQISALGDRATRIADFFKGCLQPVKKKETKLGHVHL
ncbi:phenol 2-monooxygenase [Fusarium oxysporum f. sp. phaseoli]